MTIQRISLFVTLILSVTLLGCSGGVRVSGKVTYEDGSPLTVGTIIFDDGAANFRAVMHNDGSYALGVTKDAQKIPAGNYKVWFADTTTSEGNRAQRFTVYSRALADEYTSVGTTSLTANVAASGSQVFDFVVPPPKPKVTKEYVDGRLEVIE